MKGYPIFKDYRDWLVNTSFALCKLFSDACLQDFTDENIILFKFLYKKYIDIKI